MPRQSLLMVTILCALLPAVHAFAGYTERVSVSSAGVQADGSSELPSVSGDGRFVAFDSNSDNLAPGVDSTADNGGKSLGYKQLQMGTRASQWKVAGVFDPWHRGVRVATAPESEGGATVTVTGQGFVDTWHWIPAPDKDTPSSLRCERGGQAVVTLGLEDKAPTEGVPAAR